MAKLEIRFTDGAVETKKLTRDRSFLIGSDPSADLRLTSQGIEAKHATIRWVDRRYRLDVAPNVKNVFVGVNPINQLRLKPDAEFSIANVEFCVRYDAEELGAILMPAEGEGAGKAPPLYLSKPFLGIVAGLILLAGLSVGLYFLVRERAADQQFEQAVKDLNDKLYPESLKGFDSFIAGFADDPRVDQAIFLRAKARVLPLVDAGGSSLEQALAAAEQLVTEASSTKEYAEHPTEVGDIILSVARKLAEMARDRSAPEPLSLSEKGMSLLSKALPKEKLPTDEIARVQTLQEEARLAVTKGDTIEKTLAEMDKSLADRKPATTYQLHRTLIHRYPDMRADRRMRDRMQKGAIIEKELVRFDANLPSVQVGKEPYNEPPAWTLVRRAGPSSGSGPMVLAVTADVLYGIDSLTGQVRWRTTIGYPSAFPPTILPGDASSAIVYRGSSNSIVLLDVVTGKERSRLELGSARPAIGVDLRLLDKQAWVVCQSHPEQPAQCVAMIRIENDQLSLIGSMVFPQELAAAPEFDADRNSMLAVAKEATLYSVHLDRRQVEHVYSMGHEAGGISLRPVMAGRFLLVVERKGTDASLLHCLVVKKEDGSIVEIASLPIVGQLDDPPAVRGGRLFWASNRGEHKVFELGAETDPNPLTPAASITDLEASPDVPARMLLVSDSEFWVLTKSAKRYKLVIDRKEISSEATIPLVGPAQRESRLTGENLLAMAIDPFLGGVLAQSWPVGAKGPIWSTQIGCPPTNYSLPKSDADPLLIDTWSGAEPILPGSWNTDSIVEKPFDLDARRRLNSIPTALSVLTPVEGCLSVVGHSIRRLMPNGEIKSFALPAGAYGQISPLEGGLLVPSKTGYVFWISSNDGQELADPFAAPFVEGKPIPIHTASPVDPANASAGVWAGGGTDLFRLELAGNENRVWQESFRVALGEKADIVEVHPSSTIVWVITNDDVRTIDSEKRSVIGTLAVSYLPGSIRLVGDQLIGIDRQLDLVAIGIDATKEPKENWRTELPSLPANHWVVDGEELRIANAQGILMTISLADGKVIRKSKLDRSMRDGPIKLGNQWVGWATDGSLLAWPE
jgi:hypothetical protein